MKQIIFFSLAVLLVSSSAAFAFSFDISLKQQIEEGLTKNEILCRNNSHILVERVNEKLSCVYPTTAEKLNWKLVYDEEFRENLWVHNIPEVKNCILKDKSTPLVDVEFTNSTHSFDLRDCIWIKN